MPIARKKRGPKYPLSCLRNRSQDDRDAGMSTQDLQAAVLVSYSCGVTNYHQFSCWQFCRSEVRYGSRLPDIGVLGRLHSFLEVPGEDPFSLIWVVGGIWSLIVIGLSSSFYCWFSAESPPDYSNFSSSEVSAFPSSRSPLEFISFTAAGKCL